MSNDASASLSADDVAEAARLYAKGLSLAGVAEHFAVYPSTIHVALRKAGVQLRHHHGRTAISLPS